MAKNGLTAFKRLLLRQQHIGLDTMCFIYQFSNHPRYSSLTNLIFEQLSSHTIDATTSVISLIETLILPEGSNRPDLVAEYTQTFQQFPNLQLLAIDSHVALLTAKLRSLYPYIRTPDAIQISAALVNEATLFVTNDKKLKQVKQIKVALLSDYL